MSALLPPYPPRAGGSNSRTSRTVLSRTASTQEERETTLAGAGSYPPILYGRVRVGGLLAGVGQRSGRLVLAVVWGLGPVDAVESLLLSSGEPVPAGVTAVHYLGATSQTVDAVLVEAIPGWDWPLVATVQGTLVGLCYSRIEVEPGAIGGIPSFVAQIKGRAVYNPSSGDSRWSDNPALILADFLASAVYGRGVTVDYAAGVSAAAAACGELVDEAPRRAIGLAIDRRAPVSSWVETLRTYASCFLRVGQDGWQLIPDRPVANAVRKIADSEIMADSTGRPRFSLRRLSGRETPTVVRVAYTDTSKSPWRTNYVYSFGDGVEQGLRLWVESQVSLPAIQDASQAQREAVERRLTAEICDLDGVLTLDDTGLRYQTGDVVEVSSAVGVTEKWFRVISEPRAISPGRWELTLREYQAAAYSDLAGITPIDPNTRLPNPLDPPAPTGVAAVEEVFQAHDGTWRSRVRVAWTAAEYAYLSQIEVRLLVGEVIVWSGQTRESEIPSGPVQEQVEHIVEVCTVSDVGARSAAATTSITPLGKYLIPGDVPQVTAVQSAPDAARVSWQPAVDVDIWRYELRVGAVGVSWEEATLIDLVDGLERVVTGMALGSYDMLVKAVDSVRQRSTNPARCSVTVAAPIAPAQIRGFEVGGQVRLDWDAGAGFIAGFEVRYGAVGGSWPTATVIDRLAALRLTTSDVPAGTWRFWVAAFDSAGNYSTGTASVSFEVTVDSDAYLVDEHEFLSATLTNVVEWEIRPTGELHAVSAEVGTLSEGGSAGELWPDVMSTYTNPLATYRAAVASVWLSDVWDVGSEVRGNWRVFPEVEPAIGGTVTLYIELSSDGSAWKQYPQASVNGVARYCRVRISAGTTDTAYVTRVLARLDAVTREEVFEVICSDAGPVTVSLAGEYTICKSISCVPVGATGLQAVVDNLFLGRALQGFEAWEFGEWASRDGGVITADSDAYSGAQSGRCVSNGGTVYWLLPGNVRGAVEGKPVTVTVWAKRPSSGAALSFGLVLRVFGLTVGSGLIEKTTTTSWAAYSITHTPPAGYGGEPWEVAIKGDFSSGGGATLIDSVEVRCDTSDDSFELHLFDSAGARAAGPVLVTFRGV